MSLHRVHSSSSLAEAAKVDEEQILEWFNQGKLNGHLSKSLGGAVYLHLPLTETVAAVALRDGKDPEQARRDLMAGRDRFVVPDDPIKRSPGELEDSFEKFRIRNNLPVPDRKGWGDGDPRKEAE